MPDVPRHIGGYRVVRLLGQGGMGVVYLAEGPGGEQVAVKMIRGERLDDAGYRRRFRREAEILRRVAESAPFCTVGIVGSGVDGDRAYLVTEYVDGPDLAVRVRRSGPLAGEELVELGVGIAAALQAMHGAGVVHRDLKPGNVLLTPTGPKVIDFGIAQMAGGLTTATGNAPGTAGYMSPEQAMGQPSTPASDVFAWGAVMAYAATGRCPFGEDAAPVVLHRVVYEEPDLEGVDERLRDLVGWALHKQPERRPDVQQVYAALTGSPGQGPAPVLDLSWTVPDPHGPAGEVRRSRLSRRLFGVVALLVVLVAAVVLLGPLGMVSGTGKRVCEETARTVSQGLEPTGFDTTGKSVARSDGSGQWTIKDWAIKSTGGYTWTGIRAELPDWCRFQVDLDVTVRRPTQTPSPGMGWGYGLGVCSRFDGSQPRGLSLQYAFYQGGKGQLNQLAVTHLPAANTYPDAQPDTPPGGLDYGTHHWRILYDRGKVAYQLDYGATQTSWYPVTGYPLLADCLGSEFLLRAWLAEVDVRNLVVSPG